MKDIEVAQGSRRRADLAARVRMYDNEWADQLRKELKAQFHEKSFPQVVKMLDTSMNIFRRIVREICTVYREPAERKIKDAAEQVNEDLAEFLKGLRIDQTMQVAHRYAKAATISFLLVRRVETEERLVLRVLTPDQVYVEVDPEDPTRMKTFAYLADITGADGKPKKIWTAYSEAERWFCDEAGKMLTAGKLSDAFGAEKAAAFGEDNFKNVFGIIPAVAFPAEFQIRGFWNDNWNKDAADANLMIGLLKTYENYLVKTQSFKQITLSADKVSEELKNSILDPLFPLLLGGNATAQTLDLNTQLAAIDQVIRGKTADIANNYGISQENFSLTTTAVSGFSLKIANQSLQDIRKNDIPLCSAVEQELYKVIARIAAVEELAAFPEDGVITLNPGEVSWPEEWTTERDRWQFEFENGVSSPVDYLLSLDPQKDRAAALAHIELRQAEMKKLKPKMSAWNLLMDEASGEAQPQGAGAGALGALAPAAATPTAPAEEAVP